MSWRRPSTPVPHCQHHFRLTAWERIRFTADEGVFQELSADIETANPLEFPDYEQKLAAAALKDRCQGGCGLRAVQSRRPGSRAGGDGLPVHRREHGIGGRGEDHARHAGRRGEEAAGHRLHRLGRRAHAGRHPVPHADGQDGRGHAGAGKEPLSVFRGPHRPDHRGGARLLCHAGGRHPRRARRADAVRGGARRRRDHPREGAGELPALAVPLREGFHRPGGAAQGAEKDARVPAENPRSRRKGAGHERKHASRQAPRAEGPGGEVQRRHQPRAGRAGAQAPAPARPCTGERSLAARRAGPAPRAADDPAVRGADLRRFSRAARRPELRGRPRDGGRHRAAQRHARHVLRPRRRART